jgi:hypothetical protein
VFQVEVDTLWVAMTGCVVGIFAICGYVLWIAVQDWRRAHPAGRRAAPGWQQPARGHPL